MLENFDPNFTGDPFHWIPKGLYEDLRDASNEQKITGGYVNDNVSNYYTNKLLFNAFNSTIITLQGYKTNLLNLNGNNQMTQVNSLFTDYNY